MACQHAASFATWDLLWERVVTVSQMGVSYVVVVTFHSPRRLRMSYPTSLFPPWMYWLGGVILFPPWVKEDTGLVRGVGLGVGAVGPTCL